MSSNKHPSDYSLSLEEMIAYVKGELNPDDEERVQVLISENPLYQESIKELRKEWQEKGDAFADLRGMEAAVNRHLDEQAAKIARNQLPDEDSSKDQNNVNLLEAKSITWLPTLALLVLIVIGASIWTLSQKPSTGPALAQKYLTHFEPPAPEGKDSPGLKLYRAKKYKKALPILKKNKSNLPQDSTEALQFQTYIGICQLYIEDVPAAISSLLPLVKMKKNPLSQEVHWYLALAYLMNEEKEKAWEQLDILLETNPSERARELSASIRAD